MEGKARIKEVWIAEGKRPYRTKDIQALAETRRIPVLHKSNAELSGLLPNITHQGIVAFLEDEFSFVDMDQLVQKSTRGHGLMVALDHITDEGNMGAIIRTCVFFGADGLIIPRDRSAGMTPTVLKRSAGAYVHLAVSKVVNLARALNLLKQKGFWVIGTAGESSDDIYTFDWNRSLVLVMGNEQQGLSPSIRKICDQLVGIPASGRAESLNVAVAGGVILSEIVRQRKLGKGPHID